MKLYYKELGSGEPLILLHGLFGSSDNLYSVAKELAKKYQVFVIDERNHGNSPWSDIMNYDVIADDIKEFMEDHSIKNALIVGHSMGGKASMKLAQKYPQLVRKLVVSDIAPRYYAPHHQTILAGLNSVNLETLESRTDADTQLSAHIKDLPTRQFLLKNLGRDENGQFKWKINLSVITKQIEFVGAGINDSEVINTPTLFVRGGKSDYIKLSDEPIIKKIFPNSTLKTIEGASHWIHAEKPVEFINLIFEFDSE
ncbi:alpha/beta fold hydrolase [Sporocytophaga myxococcoides]|uniref:alpha/beta fold hydrolase n=1 Tax=Sporocytophaga myxococcoides TaxID=153721 RepID=UPI0003F7A1E9|nr:alpha/beta fold hydrolase [Sporocytophaga myxococcoides]